MIWRLKSRSEDEEWVLLLPPGEHVVGSDRECDLRVAHPTVSRQHARLRIDRSGVEVEDLESKNGTWIGDRRVESSRLQEGSQISFGAVRFELQHLDVADAETAIQLESLVDSRSSISHWDDDTTRISPIEDWLDTTLPVLVLEASELSLQQAAVRVAEELLALPGVIYVQVYTLADTLDGSDTSGVLYSSAGDEEPPPSGEVVDVRQGSWRMRLGLREARELEGFDGAVRTSLAIVAAAARRTEARPDSESSPPPLPEPTTLDAVVHEVYERARQAARSGVSAVIRGETGTGKELLARYLHSASPRAERPFVALNCAALPRDLLEAELFGIDRGVATGVDPRPGCFERADGGTLFLDEIGDMPLETQAMILRVLQEKEVQRIGSRQTRPADVWVLSATNRDLGTAMDAGGFRRDLWFRIATWSPELPPLRHRRRDIAPLASWFVGREAARLGKPIRGISKAALEALQAHGWPGNVRQLEHEMQRAVAFAPRGGLIDTHCLGEELLQNTSGPDAPLSEKLKRLEREEIERALRHSDGDVEAAAEILGLARSTLYRRLSDFGLDPRDLASD